MKITLQLLGNIES